MFLAILATLAVAFTFGFLVGKWGSPVTATALFDRWWDLPEGEQIAFLDILADLDEELNKEP